MKNQAMLITYPDSLGKNLKDLKTALDAHFSGAVSGVHILPLFPSSADRGFAPTTYRKVDPAFGAWADVQAIARDYPMMLDFMINHISAQSPYYQDFLAEEGRLPLPGHVPPLPGFLAGRGAHPMQQVDAIYKRKPRAPYVAASFRTARRKRSGAPSPTSRSTWTARARAASASSGTTSSSWRSRAWP